MASGVAIRIGLTYIHVPVSNVGTPKIMLQILNGIASEAWTKTYQKSEMTRPTKKLAYAPDFVIFLQKRPPAYIGRRADVQIPMKTDVALAIILPGRTNAKMTEAMTVMTIPILVNRIVLEDFPFKRPC